MLSNIKKYYIGILILLIVPCSGYAYDSSYAGAVIDAEVARSVGRNTTVADPGSDTELVTEQAVREALNLKQDILTEGAFEDGDKTNLDNQSGTNTGDNSANTTYAIGSATQAYDADLTTYAGITPSVNVQSFLSAATYAAMLTLLDLEAGTDFYSISVTDTLLDTKEDSLGNPGTDDYILSSKTDGTRSWVALSGGGYTDLTSFVDQTAWRVFYSNTDGDVTELALGADGTYLKSNGATSAPTFETPTGAAHDAVTVSGTPDYITLSGQEIVRGTVDIGDDTNLAGNANEITLTGDTLSIHADIARDSELHDASTLNASATTGGLSLSGQEISYRAASSSQTGYMTTALVDKIEANDTDTKIVDRIKDENITWSGTHNFGSASFTAVTFPTDSVDDTGVDWGTGTNQVSHDDIPDGLTYVRTENNLTDAEKTILGNTSNTNTGDQDAAGVAFTPNGTIAASTVQLAIQEVRDEAGGSSLTEEEVEDYVGGMLGGTETRITVTYDDTGNAINFVVDDMNDDVPEAGDFGAATDLDSNGKLTSSEGTRTKSFAINEATADDDFLLWKPPHDITIVSINGVLLTGTSVVGGIDECDSAGANPVAVDSDITFDGSNDADDGTLTNAGIDADDWVRWHTTSVSSPGYLTVTIEYTVD